MKAIVAIWIFLIGLGAVGLVGWVWNIVKIVNTHFTSFDGMLIARCIGVILAPLGAVLGFF